MAQQPITLQSFDKRCACQQQLAARLRSVAAALLQQLAVRWREDGLGLALLETAAAQRQAVSLYERGGCLQRIGFGGYRNGDLPLLYQRRLRP